MNANEHAEAFGAAAASNNVAELTRLFAAAVAQAESADSPDTLGAPLALLDAPLGAQRRTPLMLAAEANADDAVAYLLDQVVPVCWRIVACTSPPTKSNQNDVFPCCVFVLFFLFLFLFYYYLLLQSGCSMECVGCCWKMCRRAVRAGRRVRTAPGAACVSSRVAAQRFA